MTAFFLAMIKFPDHQRRAQAELNAVVGPDRLPDFSDRDSFRSASDSEASDDSDDLDLDPEDIPVTGFAVASNKRNQDFHELFPTVPEGDYLIEGAYAPPVYGLLCTPFGSASSAPRPLRATWKAVGFGDTALVSAHNL